MHVLVVGSSVIDLFLSISPSHFKVESGVIALTLGDKIPTDVKTFALGGNATNIAVGLTRLGVPSTLYTYLGKDILSREIEEKVTAEGVELVAERDVSQSSPLHLIFDFKEDRIIFSHYPKAEHDFEKARVGSPDFIFLNSISDVWEHAYEKVLSYAREKSIPFAFSPGTRQLDSTSALVVDAVRECDVFFSNKEEAAKISNFKFQISNNSENEEKQMKELLEQIHKMGPEIVSITDGGNGGYARDINGNMFHVASFDPDLVSEDKTGAGDAYAAAFFGAYVLGKDVKTAMMWGGVNSEFVLQKIGAEAGLATVEQIEKALASKPEYQAESLA